MPLALTIHSSYLYLFYRWFAKAERYDIFLYYRDLGPLAPEISAFSTFTSSRHWMAHLVGGYLFLPLLRSNASAKAFTSIPVPLSSLLATYQCKP
jgi:hypothetical protein